MMATNNAGLLEAQLQVPAEFLNAQCANASVRLALEAAHIPFTLAETTMLPKSSVELQGKEAQQMLRLLEAIEDHDDVQNVYANFDIPESVMAALA